MTNPKKKNHDEIFEVIDMRNRSTRRIVAKCPSAAEQQLRKYEGRVRFLGFVPKGVKPTISENINCCLCSKKDACFGSTYLNDPDFLNIGCKNFDPQGSEKFQPASHLNEENNIGNKTV